MKKITFLILLLLLIQITVSYAQNADAGEDINTCSEYAQLNANTPATGTAYWTVVGGNAIFEDSTNPTTVISNLYEGINTLRWTFADNASTDEVVITNNIFYAFAGDDQTIDDNDNNSTYMEAVIETGTIGTWSIVAGGGNFTDLHNEDTEVTNIQIGRNDYLWTLYNSTTQCTAHDTVTINNAAFNCDAGDDQIICTDTTTLHASNIEGATTWWTSSDCEFEDPSDPNTQIYNIERGINEITWHVSKNGYEAACNVEIANYSFDTHAGDDQDLCENSSQLDANAFYGDYYPCLDSNWIGTWYAIPGLGNANFEDMCNAKTIVTELADNSNELLWTVVRNDFQEAGGIGTCMDSDTVTLEVHNLPDVAFHPTPQIQTYPQATVYIENNCSQNFDQYSWTFGNGDASIQTTYLSYFEYNYFDYGWGEYTITLTAYDGICSASDSTTIEIIAPLPGPYYNGSQNVCENETIDFNANVLYTTEGVSQYRWDIYDDPNRTNLIKQFMIEDTTWQDADAGIYYAELYATSEGSNWLFHLVRTDTMTVFANPEADFTVSPVIVSLPDQPISCTNLSTNAVNYEWNFGSTCGDSTCISYEENPVYFYTEAGEYCISLKAWNSYGCYDYNNNCDYMVIVKAEGTLVFPNAFTPNVNEQQSGYYNSLNPMEENIIFHPVHIGISEYNLKIYNRQGELVFESNDTNYGWNGYYRNQICPKAAYRYIATGKFETNQSFKNTGSVVLIK